METCSLVAAEHEFTGMEDKWLIGANDYFLG